MDFTKKYLIITGLTILILLSLFFIIGEISFKTTSNQITQYIPPASTQLAAVADFDSNLIAHYTFDDGSGTTAGDSSGHGNNGTLINGPMWMSGTDAKVGSGATKFDGTNYVDLGNILDAPQAFTLSTWINESISQSNTFVAGKETIVGYALYISDNKIYAEIDQGSNRIYWNHSLSPGTWYHIVETYDGTTLSLYVDGVLRGSKTATSPGSNKSHLYIGRAAYSDKFKGAIDDFRIYNRALSSSEITELYNSPSVDTGTTNTATTTTNTNPPANTSPSVDTGTGSNATPTPSPTQTDTNPSPIPIQTSSAVIPADRMISWNPGIPGGIPSRPAIGGHILNVKTSYGAVGDGVTDDTTAIQNAIAAAASGDVVYLPAGSYKTSSTIYLNKGVVLRGDGVSSKIIIGGSIGVAMGSRYTSAGSAVSLSDGYMKDATTITLSQDANLSPGQFIVIDELNPVEVDTTSGSYLCEDRSGGAYSAGRRCIAQINQIIAKNGPILTLKDPLYWNYDAVLNPRIYVVNLVRNAGLENVYLERTQNAGTQSSHIVSLFECGYCWVKGVETHWGKGDHFNLNFTYGTVIRDSFLYMGHNDYGVDAGFESFGVDGGASHGPSFRGFGYDSGRNYGVHIANGPNSNDLIENNIVDSSRHALIIEGPGNGNVIAYNYALNGIVYNGLDWETATLSNHGAYPYMNLWEGNYAVGKLSFDYTHGNSRDNTIFRNRIWGGVSWKTGGKWAIDLQNGQLNVNVIGNVLGHVGMGGTLEAVSNKEAIYRFGHASDGAGTISDTNVVATVIRHGNFDYITNSTIWDPGITTKTLPSSLYLSTKPSWFGSLSWPPFGPDPNSPTTLLNGTIPAEQCFHNNNLASGGTFDPTTCYGGSSSIHLPTPPSGVTPPSTSTPGDFDHDGSVNVLDFSAMKVYWNHSDTLSAPYDLNKDGTVNTLDYVIMVQNWTG